MKTRAIVLLTGAGFALSVAAGSALAQGSGADQFTYGSEMHRIDQPAPTPPKKKMASHKRTRVASAKQWHVPSGSESTNQLNDMSLQAAQRGEAFAPSPPASSAPGTPKGM